MPCQDGGRQSMAILPAQILPAPGARNQQLQERNTVGAQGTPKQPPKPLTPHSLSQAVCTHRGGVWECEQPHPPFSLTPT